MNVYLFKKFLEDNTILHQMPGIGISFGRIIHPISKLISLDMYIGMSYILPYKFDNTPNTDIPTTLYGFGPRIGLSIGLNFNDLSLY